MKLMKTFEEMMEFIEGKVGYPVERSEQVSLGREESLDSVFENNLDEDTMFTMLSFAPANEEDFKTKPSVVLLSTEIEFDDDTNEELESTLVAFMQMDEDEEVTNLEIYIDKDGNEII